MIKVFLLISNPYKITNPFAWALIDGIEEHHSNIKWGWGYDIFWSNLIWEYDIVLCHWPEAPLFWADGKHTFEEFQKRIIGIKSKGIKLICFVHNIRPHYSNDQIKNSCYSLIYSSADVLLHMGQYSKDILEKEYYNAQHLFISPHFIYDKIYQNENSKEEGCQILGLDPTHTYILAFGAFRDDEEREIVANLAHDLRAIDDNMRILAPSYTTIPLPKNWLDVRPRLQKYWLKRHDHIICNGSTFNSVPDSLVPFYYAVADVCFIHRKEILNSGNVPMAFLMNKVVSGPDKGNVGEILTELKNPTFDVNNRQSIVDSVLKALALAKEGLGKQNHDYAMNHFSTHIFSEKLYNVLMAVANYQQVKSNDHL